MSTSDPATWGDPDLVVAKGVPQIGTLDAIRGSVGRRHLVPTSVALVGTDLLYGTVTRLRASKRDYAERTMRAILPPGTPDAEVARLAPHHVASMARAWELTWRPGELAALPLRGEHHLRDAVAAGRGVLVSYVHYGPEMGWVRIAPLTPMLAVLGDWIVDPVPPGYNGLQVERRRTVLAEAGFHLSSVATSARRMLSVLRCAGTVLLAMDVPGARLTRYLGKDVEMADGTARLATSTGALVVPAALVPDGRRWAVQIQPALDPQDLGGAPALHQALADVHTGIVLKAPEHLGSPLRQGFWGTADANGWSRS